MNPTGEAFHAFVMEALDLAFGCFAKGDNIPFVVLGQPDGRRDLVELKPTNGTVGAKLIELGRELIVTFDDAEIYGLLFDGYYTDDAGTKTDAVIMEAGQRGHAEGHVFVQRYTVDEAAQQHRKVGQPMLTQVVKNLWGSED